MRLLCGTSGFAYKEWKGSFYPERLSDSAMLAYYAARFPSVEMNNTFYRMPPENVLGQWAEQVPEGFTFVLKASRAITHMRRLNAASAEPLGRLVANSAALGDRLGALLFQMPPNMKSDVERLRDFLAMLPAGRRSAFEFRHESWFTDATYDALREHNAAFVIAHSAEAGTPFVATADWGYLRLRGEKYAPAKLREWAQRVADASWTDAYVFFKHEDAGTGPKLANRFIGAFDRCLASGKQSRP
jgi:uncharacterized protein YecE (DUF72 family)